MAGEEGESNEPQTVVDGGEVVPVNVRCSNGSKFIVRTSLESTVESFKALLAQNCDVPANHQRLIHKGRILKDDHTLLSYGLQADQTLHMVRLSAPPPETQTTSSPSVVTTRGVGLNPHMVRDMMNAPAVQNIMNNPELMRSLIMSNPRMRELVDRNPELGHILNDPSILRQSLEAARNPELMREMTRSTDRALSNIEATPEGFNMLRRMYEDVQEPLMNVSNPFGARGRDASNSRMTTNGETGGTGNPNTNPLPNPWGAAAGSGQTTRPRRRNSRWDVGAPVTGGLAGLSGLGMLGGDQTVGATPDASQVNQFLQNPAMSQMMQSLLSDPQYMNQITSLNPQLQSLMDSSPQVREMMQNPEFLRMLSSPDTMRQMMSLQQSLLSGDWSTTRQVPGQTGATTGCNNEGLDLLMSIFGSLGAGGGLSGGANQSNVSVPNEELYATQLQQLEEMGFFDRAENIRALRATNGNVNAAVERLLGSIAQ